MECPLAASLRCRNGIYQIGPSKKRRQYLERAAKTRLDDKSRNFGSVCGIRKMRKSVKRMLHMSNNIMQPVRAVWNGERQQSQTTPRLTDYRHW
ncbi:hypothetical protein WA026_007192 [Henosepilachna vigintioctopunctata]|uniref:Uncharacterized protein n=1 Tax=Henosepilachna vigintioctopunctata TaxID=420089 RepID=A0AAW1V9M6_9CUCU